ncbi:hypothetical protein CDD83_5412 [Cordyceps sp. RAO-2017]|nr:hypothetical protein CDD83_5412 [Cordyceps sp. RAO-2017]
MAAMAEQSFHVFQQQHPQHHHHHHHHHDSDSFARYPEPPHNAFASPPLDMSNMAAEAHFGGSFPRSGRDQLYPAASAAGSATGATTTMGGFETSLYGDSANYVFNGRASPGSFPDEGDMRLSSSGLSTTSAPSAPSSAMGSPQSNHGQLSAAPEWSAQGLAVQPSIVGNDYMAGHDYFPGAGMDDLGGFVDFGVAHTGKTFVGMWLYPLLFSTACQVPGRFLSLPPPL